ncbi:unnamed protein product, partial [marine sediment metagenome]
MKQKNMYKVLGYLGVTLFMVTFFSCSHKSLTYNYEVEKSEQSTQGDINL